MLESTLIRFADDGPLGWRPVTVEFETRDDFKRGYENGIRVRLALDRQWHPDALITGVCEHAAQH